MAKKGTLNHFKAHVRPSNVLTLVSSCSWLPILGTDDWQADLTLLVNVGMVDFGFEGDPGRFKRVFSREDELHSKCSLVVRCAVLV